MERKALVEALRGIKETTAERVEKIYSEEKSMGEYSDVMTFDTFERTIGTLSSSSFDRAKWWSRRITSS